AEAAVFRNVRREEARRDFIGRVWTKVSRVAKTRREGTTYPVLSLPGATSWPHRCFPREIVVDQPRTDLGRDRRVQYLKRAIICLLLLTVAAFVIVALWPKKVPAVTIFPETVAWKYKPPVPDRWIPLKWAWYWRGKEFVLGKRRTA